MLWVQVKGIVAVTLEMDQRLHKASYAHGGGRLVRRTSRQNASLNTIRLPFPTDCNDVAPSKL